MRHRMGISGATLIYGPQPGPPDLMLASQFLIDDLRRDGRTITGVRLSRHALRLRADGFDLALSLNDAPLPLQAFTGAARPVPDGSDLARGRVMHALRHHRWVLGVLMRLRGVQPGQSMDERLDVLPGECRSLIATVAEAAPPALVIWQANGAICTASEFPRLPAAMLDGPASALDPLCLTGAMSGPRERPAPVAGVGHAPITPRRAIPAQAAPAEADVQQPAATGRPAFADGSPQSGLPTIQPLVANAAPARPGKAPPDSRAARAQRQSAGRLFGGKPGTRQHQITSATGLARRNDQLAHALRIDSPPATHAAAVTRSPAPSRAGAGLRIAIMCMALAVIGPSAGGPDTASRASQVPLSGALSVILALPAP
ncbi:MAG: hypothetical protein JJT95_02035 [Pararhodobacter sp.]|nr:hypothetical protein [Pararhodobacter sp.]